MVSFKGARGATPKFSPTIDGYCDGRVFSIDVGFSLPGGQTKYTDLHQVSTGSRQSLVIPFRACP
jgi:hypothetical protein